MMGVSFIRGLRGGSGVGRVSKVVCVLRVVDSSVAQAA
jgi:hypothetical protein